MLSSADSPAANSLAQRQRQQNEQQSYKGPETVWITIHRSRCVSEDCKAVSESKGCQAQSETSSGCKNRFTQTCQATRGQENGNEVGSKIKEESRKDAKPQSTASEKSRSRKSQKDSEDRCRSSHSSDTATTATAAANAG